MPENTGKGGALQRGVLAAQGAWILTMDADMATDPNMLEAWLESGHWDPEVPDRILLGSREYPDSQVEDGTIRRFMGTPIQLPFPGLVFIALGARHPVRI